METSAPLKCCPARQWYMPTGERSSPTKAEGLSPATTSPSATQYVMPW